MAYTVSNTDGSRTITVADGTFDTTTYSVTLIGKNITNYGDVFVKNSIRHLENFASATAPSVASPLVGQVWYDKTGKVLRVYKSASEGWVRVSSVVSETPPSDGLSDGATYFDSSDNKLKIYSGGAWADTSYAGTVTDEYQLISALGTPSSYGTRGRTVFLKDSAGVARAVHAITYVNNSETDAEHPNGETIMAVFSDHTEFLVSDVISQTDDNTANFNWYDQIVSSDGFKGSDGTAGKIKKGLNLRNEYANTSIALADRAIEADSVTGNLKIGSSYYPISTIVRSSADIVPDQGDNYDLGSNTNRWQDLHVNGTAFFGQNSGTSVIRPASGAQLSIGQSGNKIHQIHATTADITTGNFADVNVTEDLTVTGNIIATSITADINFDDFTSTNATISNVITATNGIASLGYLTTQGYANIGATLTVTGQTNLNGSTRIGDSASDGVEFVADIISGMRPNADSSFDIGADLFRWRQLFVDDVTITDKANIGGKLRIENADAASSDNDYTVSFRTDGGAVVRKNMYVKTSLDVGSTIVGGSSLQIAGSITGATTINASGLITGGSLTDGVATLDNGALSSATTGAFSGQVNVGSLVSGGAVSGTTGTFTGNTQLGSASSNDVSIQGRVTSPIVPKANNTHDLGTSSLKWNDVYAETFNGTATAAQYADLAEIYSSDADYEAGTVVKIGGDAEVTQTNSFNDPDVFGVVSTNPAYLMNSEADGVAVAMTGRVPCKVEGRIKKGERLVSGSKPGFAKALGSNTYDMRSIIGRALVDKDTFDDGVIEVVIGVK
tara:strand:- start:9541 stop:11901 length:2361 start_codon:yes stop_codon:yes gene_type:complete